MNLIPAWVKAGLMRATQDAWACGDVYLKHGECRFIVTRLASLLSLRYRLEIGGPVRCVKSQLLLHTIRKVTIFCANVMKVFFVKAILVRIF